MILDELGYGDILSKIPPAMQPQRWNTVGAVAAFYFHCIKLVDKQGQALLPALFHSMAEHTTGVAKESWLFLASHVVL